jgi:hypothetical protein
MAIPVPDPRLIVYRLEEQRDSLEVVEKYRVTSGEGRVR